MGSSSPTGPGLPGAPQDDAGLTRKFEMSHVGGATCRTPLRSVPSPTGLPSKRGTSSGSSQERTGESGAFGLWPHPRGSSPISS